ncbi:MAG: helix-turn-helix domain-containing protein [Treponema sp.]|jgi:transposase|nr:helix-turn-helix domain-containing protein [Treponema sp.]
MRKKIYRVKLTADEKKQLEDIINKGVHPARQMIRASILLLLNEEDQDGNPIKVPEQTEIAQRYQCSTALVYIISRQYVKEGLERVLKRKKRETPPVPAKVTGEIEAKIIALCGSEPPPGYSRWTLRLLEERSKVELGIDLSYTTIWGVLKKHTAEAPSQEMPTHTAATKYSVYS